MLAKEMYEFRDMLAQKDILFCYSGAVTEPVLSAIGEALRMKLENTGVDKKIILNVFTLFVEQVQNIIRYSVEKEEANVNGAQHELRYGAVNVGQTNDGTFYVSCGNLVVNKDVKRLEENLEHIKGLEEEELKRLYKQILKGETPEGSKGAGVGFLDIARRATKGFEFDFTPVDQDLSYFSIKAYV